MKTQDDFWDLAAQVATMVHRVNKTLNDLYDPNVSGTTRNNAAVLAAELGDLRSRLQSWHFSAEKDGELYSEIPTVLDSSDYIFLTGRVIQFRDLHAAKLITSYWTYAFYLWDVSSFYNESLAAIKGSSGPIFIPPSLRLSENDVPYMAGMMCQCIWWFMTHEPPNSTLLIYTSFPLRVATRYYQSNPKRWQSELEWCLATSDKIANSGMRGELAESFVDPFIPRMFKSQDQKVVMNMH